jgi:hypothetical protein
MSEEKEQFFNLLSAVMYAQAELLKNIPEENVKLLNKRNKHLPNNMSLVELLLNNASNTLDILIKRLSK